MARITAYITVPNEQMTDFEDAEVSAAIQARLDECYPTAKDGSEGCLVLTCIGAEVEDD